MLLDGETRPGLWTSCHKQKRQPRSENRKFTSACEGRAGKKPTPLGEHHKKRVDAQRFPKEHFLSVCSGCLGFFLQFLAASLVSDRGSSLSCDVSDALKFGKISSCLPRLQVFAPSVGYLLKRRWAIP